MNSSAAYLVPILALVVAGPAWAQDHGGGGGVGCGDVFGDLIEIQREAGTGQPILQKRWVELPKEAPGYGWGYCKIAVDSQGNELRFAPLSCDVHPDDLVKVVSVDYFGRLNGGRTKEKNHRMHLNEVISTIKSAGAVHQESAGRLRIGYDCSAEVDKDGFPKTCAEWAVIDSPMESLGLYTRLMKYGHLQTDPLELDIWAHGEPATAAIQFNPALAPQDWKKFHKSLWHLLPGFTKANTAPNPWRCFLDADGDQAWEPYEEFVDVEDDSGLTNGTYDLGEPFADLNGNGLRDDGTESFAPACAVAEDLTARDFTRGGSFLGGAANKTGKVTVDLVQYLNRILKITRSTETTAPTTRVLPARIRHCQVSGDLPNPDEGDPALDPIYFDCAVADASNLDLVNADLFPDATELFVDYGAADFTRGDTMDDPVVTIIVPVDDSTWQEGTANLKTWLDLRVPGQFPASGLAGFVWAGTDALRTVEFIHNYAVPDSLPFFPYPVSH